MQTLEHHASIATNIASINSRINTLASSFATVAQRTAADDALIDLLSGQAQSLLAAAAALKTINYVAPTPTQPE